MTPDDVRALVAKVREAAEQDGDDEVAHSREDDARRSVLKAISRGECEDPRGCAAAVLETDDIGFSRWCA